tara:strand:- start:64 stop:309 length:246 start_codon:yes stop_codon:yes gene_type:complete
MPRYFNDLTIEEMFEHHDHTYMMSDDHRAYTEGSTKSRLIEEKIDSIGGWTKELVDKYNKYAPKGFEKDWEWIEKHKKFKR